MRRHLAAAACGAGFETVVQPGTYTLVVEGYGPNARGRVVVDIWSETLPGAGANETCETAEPIQVGNGGSLRGDTRLANDDYKLFDFNG